MKNENLRYTGTQISYYHICPRKLWLFSKHMEMEAASNNQNVQLGKLIDENSYNREKKNLELENIQIDWLSSPPIIHEVKKSDRMEDAHLWQLKYYLYYLKQKGLENIIGELHYPKLKKKKQVDLTAEDEDKLCQIFAEIDAIIAGEAPAKLTKISICRKCAYYEYCYA